MNAGDKRGASPWPPSEPKLRLNQPIHEATVRLIISAVSATAQAAVRLVAHNAAAMCIESAADASVSPVDVRSCRGRQGARCNKDDGFWHNPRTVPTTPHQGLAPSPWVTRWLRLLAANSLVLDVACGSGRHTHLALEQGHRVVAIDRNAQALSALVALSGVRTVEADLEGADWPLPGHHFDCVIVTNYLHRPLFKTLLDSVSEKGLLIYETFARGNERFGRPSNPDYLLRPAELCDVVRPSLRVLGYEDVYVGRPKPAMVQRVCACGEAFVWPENAA